MFLTKTVKHSSIGRWYAMHNLCIPIAIQINRQRLVYLIRHLHLLSGFFIENEFFILVMEPAGRAANFMSDTNTHHIKCMIITKPSCPTQIDMPLLQSSPTKFSLFIVIAYSWSNSRFCFSTGEKVVSAISHTQRHDNIRMTAIRRFICTEKLFSKLDFDATFPPKNFIHTIVIHIHDRAHVTSSGSWIGFFHNMFPNNQKIFIETFKEHISIGALHTNQSWFSMYIPTQYEISELMT